jgi:hypothetical protein
MAAGHRRYRVWNMSHQKDLIKSQGDSLASRHIPSTLVA